jgi:hypothetical protein
MALPLLLSNQSELENILVTNNEFDFRTEKSRKRFLAALNSAFISKNKKINQLATDLIAYLKNDETSKAVILFWLFSINNKLFYALNKDVFLKYYYQGRAEFPKDNVIAYIKDLISKNAELKGKWSEITIDTIASKYLTILKKLNLLEGNQKKRFCHIIISDELLAVFIHLIDLLESKKANFLDDELTAFTFISKDSILERLKKIGKKDWIKMNYTGTSLNVEAAFNINDIIDGIYRRA